MEVAEVGDNYMTCQLHCSCKIPPLLLHFSPVSQFLLVWLPLHEQAHADVTVVYSDPSRPGDGSLCCCVGKGQCSQVNRTVASIPKQPGDQSSHKSLTLLLTWNKFLQYSVP